MSTFLFADGEKVCLYKDGQVVGLKSKFIEKYKKASLEADRAKSWKHSGEGAQFRGDVIDSGEDNFCASISGVYVCDESEAVYSFKINRTSGIYKMRTDDEKAEEVHIINSVDYEFYGGCLDANSGLLATSLRRNYLNSDIALFDTSGGDYRTLTDGDTLDEDPFFDPDDGNIIYFASRGVGRDSSGAFVSYSPSAIYKLDIAALEVEEIVSSEKYSYFKPVVFNGKLYAVRTPAKEKKPNPVIEILLIPFRIIQAIANFINAFVRAFTGKSLASGGANPTKGREYDSRKEYIKGNLVNVEKEMKRNAKKSKGDYGFIPMSWQLVEAESGKVIKSGVADFDILPDGTFITTNGKRIFAVKEGKSEKLCNTDKCLNVACIHTSKSKSDLFGL